MMKGDLSGVWRTSSDWVHGFAQGVIALTALGLIGATIAAAFGALPWPTLSIFYGTFALPKAGMWVQVGLSVLFVILAFYLPANARMARLERSHRSFQMGMEDVARAYRIAHASDRAGVFSLSGEFDSMRARLEQLRRHPDLRELEPEVLQLAAQMSLQTRDLARAYSDQKVERARMFLKQRQEEAAIFAEKLELARAITDELKRWLADIEAEERKNHQQIKRLEGDLREVLPALGWAMEPAGDPGERNVVNLPKPIVVKDAGSLRDPH